MTSNIFSRWLLGSLFILSVLFQTDAQAQCQQIQAQLVSTSPAAQLNTIRICQGETVQFVGSGQFELSSAGATYLWYFGDGDSTYGNTATHTYPNSGIYIIDLVITDAAGCNNTNRIELAVQVSTTPNFAGTNVAPNTICLGDQATLTGVATPVPAVFECAPPVSDTTFLPDGSGVSYQTSIEVECFSPNLTISNASQLESVCLNMEHSYMGDLQISIACPNGQSAILKEYPGGGGTYIGGANDDGTLAQGVGATYCFSTSAVWGTMVAENTLGNWVTAGSNPPNNSMTPGTYQPFNSFNNLIGCPLNGSWTITVTDNLGIDNGYIFWWGVNFDPTLLPGNYSFTPNFITQQWLPDPSIVSTVGNNATVQPAAGGNQCYTFEVVDDFNCTYDTTICMTTIDPGIAGTNGADTICLNQAAVSLFDYLGGGPTPGGTWTGPGTTSAGIFSPELAGVGVHTLTYTLTSGMCSVTAQVIMTVIDGLQLDFDYTMSPGCGTDTIHFINNSEPGTYFWDFGDGSVDSINASPSHAYSPQGLYTVWLKGENYLGCQDSMFKIIDTRHTVDAAFNLSTDSVCQGLQNVVFFEQSTGNVDGWMWSFGDGDTAYTQGVQHIYQLAGTHTVTLVVYEAVTGCTDTAFATIYVDSLPHLKLITDKDTVCNGERVNFSLDYLNTATAITWDFGDGNFHYGLDASTYHSYDNPGSYVVSVTTDHPVCASVNAKDTILVKPYPVVNLGPDTALCLNGERFTIGDFINITNPKTRWQWNNGDTTAAITILHPGTYTVTADLDGCTSSDEIVIHKDCYADVPNVFTPNGDGNNDYFYPRQILSEGVTSFSMTVFNRWGEKIFETDRIDGRGWDGRYNGKDQPSGVYIYLMDVGYKNGKSEHYEGNVTLLR